MDRTADPRAAALAHYLREQAAAFSLSADATGEQHIADAGMALLDAADLAGRLRADDSQLETLTLAGRFEAMPGGATRFVDSPDLRAAVRRPLSGSSRSGKEILALVVTTAGGR